jgi:hypothetical protein
MKATVQKTSASLVSDARLKLDPCGDVVTLDGDQHAYVRDAAGWTVRVMDGTVWITQDGDQRDIVLRAGDSFQLDRRGPAMMSPLRDAKVSVRLRFGRCSPRPREVMSAQPAYA